MTEELEVTRNKCDGNTNIIQDSEHSNISSDWVNKNMKGKHADEESDEEGKTEDLDCQSVLPMLTSGSSTYIPVKVEIDIMDETLDDFITSNEDDSSHCCAVGMESASSASVEDPQYISVALNTEQETGTIPHETSHNSEVVCCNKKGSTSVKVSVCPYCGKLFSRSGSLNRHLKTVHEKLKKYICVKCDKCFGESGHLKRHIMTVHDVRKPHICVHCHKSFGESFHLKTHIATVHEKVKKYVCILCKKKFGFSNDLKRHLVAVHEKQKKYVCIHCHVSFSRFDNLKTHMATVHEKQKPYNCSKCHRPFGRLGDLKKHVTAIHDKLS